MQSVEAGVKQTLDAIYSELTTPDVRKPPFSKEEWKIAVEREPSLKEDFYTILSDEEAWPEFARMDRARPSPGWML